MVEVEEVGIGLERTAIFAGGPFVMVCVPAFNEEKTVAKIVIEAQKYADTVVVCDDGSTDMTTDIAERLGADTVGHECNVCHGATRAEKTNREK